MSNFEIYKSNDYQIKVEQTGRAGYIFYIEKSRLPFAWEMIISGRKTGTGVVIPSPKEWDNYCEKNGANWAKGRRDEIVRRIGEAVGNGWYSNGTYEIRDDRWLDAYPGQSLISKFIHRLFL